MSAFGGLLAFELKRGGPAALSFVDKLQLIGHHSSLGGISSNVIRPAALFGEQLGPEVVARQGITPGMIRMAAGIENTADLLADVERALG